MIGAATGARPRSLGVRGRCKRDLVALRCAGQGTEEREGPGKRGAEKRRARLVFLGSEGGGADERLSATNEGGKSVSFFFSAEELLSLCVRLGPRRRRRRRRSKHSIEKSQTQPHPHRLSRSLSQCRPSPPFSARRGHRTGKKEREEEEEERERGDDERKRPACFFYFFLLSTSTSSENT